MADERDPRVSQRYRELGDEQPPRELDQAILAAAHRAADRPHAPLVTPAGRHRWYFSLAAVAVLVLAVAITLHVDRQPPQTSEAISTPPPASATERQAGIRQEAAKKEARAKPDAPARAVDDVAVLQERRAEPQPAPAAPPASNEAKPSKESALMKDSRDASGTAAAAPESDAFAAARVARAKTRLDAPAETPERELERIAELRRLGRDEDADKALAEFRKRYPDYRITEEMRAKVERPAPARAR